MRIAMSCLLLSCLAGMVMWAALPSMTGEADETTVVKCQKKAVIKLDGGDPIVLELKDLADGESKTYQSGEHTVVVTRKGDRIAVTVDGKEMDLPGLQWEDKDGQIHIFAQDGDEGQEGKKLIFVTEDVEKGEGKDGSCQVVIHKQKGDGPNEVEVVKTVKVIAGDGKVVVCGDEDGKLVEIEGLKKGETKVVTKDGKTFTVTRAGEDVEWTGQEGDTFTVKVDDEGGAGEHKVILVQRKDGPEGEAAAEKKVLVLVLQDDAGQTSHVKIECREETGQEPEVTVKINDETHLVKLGDLADGGSKTFRAGEHSIEVSRRGNALQLTLDGKPMGK